MKTQILMIGPFYQSWFAVTLMSVCEDELISKVVDRKITGKIFPTRCVGLKGSESTGKKELRLLNR